MSTIPVPAPHSLAAQCNTVNITHPILVPIPVHTTSTSGMSSQQVLRRISPSDEHVMMDIYDAELIPSISEMPSKEPVNCETDVSMLSLPLYDAMSPSRVKFASAAMIEYDPEQVSLQDNCTDGISDGFSDMYTSFPGQHFELVSQDVPAYTNHVSAVKSQERVCDGENITISKNCIGVQTNEKWLRYSAKLNQQTIQQLRTKLHTAELSTRYTITSLETDDKKCKYVTGISSGIVLRQLYEAVKNDLPFYEETYREKMFILAIRKIRLNEPFYTLSRIYDMHHSTVADKVFQIIHCVYPFMAGLVRWPSRDVIKKHMPESFRKKYGDRVTIIIDCFEIPIESPKSEEMVTNANVYSFYKHHKTVKILAGITPARTIAFVSEAFGGRTSDQQVVRLSGFLDMIEEGDFVLADRGFLIADMLSQKKAVLNIPTFKKANKQLEPLDACQSRELAALRIHVERLIGSMRQKCMILSSLIPITLLERWNGDMLVLDQIIKIGAAIVNLCPSVVS